MSGKLFGTDGVRGVANRKLTPELALRLGQAAGRWLLTTESPRRAVVGRDTRRSGPMLGAAFAAGLCSVGIDVTSLAVAPTGAISHAARTGGYGLGAVISASHNPAPDNGIKLFDAQGRKMADEAEAWIQRAYAEELSERPEGAGVGFLTAERADLERYAEMLVDLVPEGLSGMRIAVDASHGAAFEMAVQVFRRLGADLHEIGVQPDGMNINTGCGATHPQTIQNETVIAGCDVGVAFDGDADRAVFSDDQGRLINGDRTMGIWAAAKKHRGGLEPAVVVGTVMSNTGFERYLLGEGVELVRTPVGDKYVSRAMAERHAKVGGEQSGHIIFADRSPTGDGLITALEFLRVVKLSGVKSSELYESYEPWPQLMVNVHLESRDGLDSSTPYQEALRQAEAMVGEGGRLVVRPSGTQPMVRVMAESQNAEDRDRAVACVVDALLANHGGSVFSRVDLTHALGD